MAVFESAAEGSDLESRSLAQLESFVSARLTSEKTLGDCEEILGLMPDLDDQPGLKEAYRKVILKMIDLATTTEEALSILQSYESDEARSEFDILILRRALALAATSQEAGEVHEETEEGSEFEREVFVVWTSFLQTVEECQDMWDEHGTDTECGKLAILRAGEIISTAKAS